MTRPLIPSLTRWVHMRPLPLSCPFSSSAQWPRPSPRDQQQNSTCTPSTKSFCLLFVFTFGDTPLFEKGWGMKVCPGLLCTTVRQMNTYFFFLNPGPQWGGKWIWYGKVSHQFGYIGIPFFSICIIFKKAIKLKKIYWEGILKNHCILKVCHKI